MKKKIILVGLVVFMIALFCGCGKIPSGYTGVKIVDGVVQEESLSAGRYGALGPRVELVKVNNKRQTTLYSNKIFGESNSQVVVYAQGVSITYQIMPEASVWLVTNIGDNFLDIIIPEAKIASSVKNALANIETQNCTNRSYIEPAVKQEIQEAIDEYYYPGAIVIYDVSIEQMDFEDSYNEQIAKISNLRKQQEADAITNQMKIDAAKAEAEAEATKAEAARKTAEAEAEIALVEAQSMAEVARISANSYAETQEIEATADINRMKEIIKILTPEYIEYIRANQWNGSYPNTYLATDEAVEVLNIPIE